MSRTGTKSRMIESAITLLREQGAAGVTIDAVLAHSGAPRGSVYHHFPGGRTELLLTAGRAASDFISDLIREAARATDPAAAIEQFATFWKASLEASDFRAGCPVVALAVDHRPDLPETADLARDTFEQWQADLSDTLAAHGAHPDNAAALAIFAIAAIEGAVVLCRSKRSTEPLDHVTAQLIPVLTAGLNQA